MGSLMSKQEAKRLVVMMPDNSTWDDLIHEINVREVIERGLDDSKAGRTTYDEKGHGLFTYFLLKGIKNEDVVRADGSIKIDDLYSYLKSHTLVSNFQVADDLVYAAVRGKIEKMDVLSEGWDEKDRNLYRVKIKALVGPMYPEKGQGLSLKLALSKPVLKEGEETTIIYQSNDDCYVYIFSIAADGSVTLLLPNAMNKDNRLLLSKAYEFPPAGSSVRLQAMFLPGFKGAVAEERIKVIATKREEAIVPLGFQEGMFKVYDAKSTGMISDLVKKLNQLEPTDWTEATVVYKIVR